MSKPFIEGRVTNVYFQATNGFTAAKIDTDWGQMRIVGDMYGIRVGDLITIKEFKQETHPTYGDQIRVLGWTKLLPKTREAVIEFLSSGLIRNVGPARANKIIDTLGANALSTIVHGGPDILRQVPGIQKLADQIYSDILSHTQLQAVIQELVPLGLSTATIIRCFKHFDINLSRVIKENPYQLLDYIPFSKADELAMRFGLGPNSPERIQAAVLMCLKEAAMNGHCFLPEPVLATSIVNFLGNTPSHDIKLAITALQNSNRLKTDKTNIYLPINYVAELDLAHILNQLCYPAVPPAKLERTILSYSKKTSIFLSAEQKESIRALFSSNLLILTGGPGTGKTETIKAAVRVYKTLFPSNRVFLTAPTGRAARRLAELTGSDAQTVHRLLKIQPSQAPLYNEKNPLPCDLLVIDEASMLNTILAQQLFCALTPNTKVLIVGDKNQLPPIGAGNVFSDLLKTKLPTIRLTKVFRQAAESQIITNAHRVNQGQYIEINESIGDAYFLNISAPRRIVQFARKSFLRLLERGYGLDDIQVLVPMHKGQAGVEILNMALQDCVQQDKSSVNCLKTRRKVFYVGDKVIQLVNNYDKDVLNGDIGIIEVISNTDPQELIVRYNERTVSYSKSELSQISLAYAITIHKAQGSEYKAVILILANEHKSMLARNLLYTALSRAEEFLCIIGPQKALQKAIENDVISKRNTSLATRITTALDDSKQHMSQTERGG